MFVKKTQHFRTVRFLRDVTRKKNFRVAISVRFSVRFIEENHTDSENAIIFYFIKLEKLITSKPFENKKIPAMPEAKII